MIRRGSGRTPPFILVGLVLIVLILGFNYWTLSSQNADLQQEVEKLQAELKISAMKQEQSETKNAALQETVHEMDSISANLKKKLEEEKDVLKSKDHDNQKKEYEITSLKNKLVKLQEHIDTITQQLEDHEAELSKAKETNIHLATERDDAVEAIAEKDALINTLKRQLEQEKSRSSALQYSVDSLKKKVTQTFGELTACQDKFSDIETLAKSLKAKEQKEKSRNGILKTNVDTLNIKLANTVAELTECQDSVSKLKASTVAHETEHVKAQDEIAAAEHEKLAIVQPKIVPGPMNLPSVEYKEPYLGPGQLGYVSRRAVHTRDWGMHGITFHRDIPIIPRDPPNAPRSKPRFSVADMANEPAALSQNGANIGHDNAAVDTLVAPQPINHGNSNDVNLHVDQGNPQIQAPGPAVVEQPAVKNRPVIEPMIPGNVDGQDPQKDVLAPPPQHQEDSNVMNAKSDGNVSELDKHIREAETQLRDEEIQNDRYRAFQDQMKPSKVQKHKEKVVSLIGKYHRQTEDIRGKTHTLKRIDEPQVQHKYDDADHNNAQEQIDEPQAQHEHDDMAQNNAQEQIDEPQAPHEEQDDNAHNNAQEQIDEPQTRHEAQDENHNNAQEQIDVPEISQANGHPGHE
ncbi:putative leucine-rich repeat-containing protein DDB_G0290503 isoform X2 [Cherax quadricarinatus]|uniref:putative leucine-rich repeat-containing protein DDB_G0290503 isoform X2 n=1 Tax=Cherax quadricarinatus TaxID=27406 RepID=UPI002377F9D5|nr:cortactin-binding protein 2-like isoform X2 [Cherax quadricarinatus]